VLEVNRQAVALSGYSDEALHTMSIDQLHEVKWDKTGSGFEVLKRNGGCNYESDLRQQNNVTMPIEVHAHRVEFEETDSVQWILRDLTERKELDALRDDMTAMIYHDIRSPLSNIVSSLELMNGLIPEEETLRTMLNIARNSTGRIQRLVNSLLDINRLESGQKIADQTAVDPFQLVSEALKDVEPAALGRQQKLENKIVDALPLIWVDPDMIHRMFINLLENAIKYTSVGGLIEIGGYTGDVNLIKFWVRDNGPGISGADRERVFDKFTRLRGKKNNNPSGIGVGLAFCKLAVQGHGGEIRVESEEGIGTTFWVTLPVAQKKATGQLKRQTGRLTMKEDNA